MKNQNKIGKQLKGFSFAETLLASFVLAVGLLTVVKLFQVSVTQSFTVRDATIATSLAQEGVELVRNVRDNNYLANPANPLSVFSTTDKHCRVSIVAVAPIQFACNASPGSATFYSLQPVINANTTTAYTHSGVASVQKFKRYIYADYSTNGPTTGRVTVKSYVSWGSGTIQANGTFSGGCTIQNQCVYSEVVLSEWQARL